MIVNDDDTSLYIDESEKSFSKQDLSEPIYSEVKRSHASRQTIHDQECGLPPSGRRTSSRIRMRSRPTRTYQLQSATQFSSVRPTSFHEQTLNRQNSSQRQSAVDTYIQMTTHQTPSLDSSDFLGEMSQHLHLPIRTRPVLNTIELKNRDYKSFTTIQFENKSIVKRSCLKTHKSQIKKSVRFDSHPPTIIRPLSIDDEQQNRIKINDKRPTTTTHTVHRSFSLSPSPSSRNDETNHQQRRHRCTKKDSNDELKLPIGNTNHTNRAYKRLSVDIDDISKVTINHEKDLLSIVDNKNSSINSKDSFNPKNTKRSSIMIQSDDDHSSIYPSNHSQSTNMMQTSTLIISTPQQYHYYLYPTKKTHSRMNSAGTNSSSSSSSDHDEETLNSQKAKPIILSDSVQNFWPPPPSPSQLNNDYEQNNNQHENKKFLKNDNDDSSSMSNTLLPDDDEELRSYSEQSSLSTTCLRIASDSSIEDTQESYSERIRQISKRPVMMNGNHYALSRSKLPADQIREDIAKDFQTKRQFFENRNTKQLPQPPRSQPELTIRTTKYFDSLTNPISIYRKPVRIVKAMQRSTPVNEPNSTSTYSTQYMKHLFPMSDRFKYSQIDIPRDKIKLQDEIQMNNQLEKKFTQLIESRAEKNEIDKFKSYINDIETITSIFLKLSCRLAKIENDLLTLTDDNAHAKTNLLEQRAKIHEKQNEAKILKDGIDRRCSLVRIIVEKYLTDEQIHEYEQFIRMKSSLLIDEKDLEENIQFIQKQTNKHL